MAIEASICGSHYPRAEHHDSIVIEFASDHALVSGILRACCDFVLHDGAKSAPNLEIVLRELLNNAIEHGNGNVHTNRVRCELTRLGSDRVLIRVSDQGKGFDHHQLDLVAPKFPGARMHRGLVLVAAFCEELSFNAPGNQVTARMTWDTTVSGEEQSGH